MKPLLPIDVSFCGIYYYVGKVDVSKGCWYLKPNLAIGTLTLQCGWGCNGWLKTSSRFFLIIQVIMYTYKCTLFILQGMNWLINLYEQVREASQSLLISLHFKLGSLVLEHGWWKKYPKMHCKQQNYLLMIVTCSITINQILKWDWWGGGGAVLGGS